jgi:hypothetical protein
LKVFGKKCRAQQMNFIVAWIEEWFGYCFGKCIFNEISKSILLEKKQGLVEWVKITYGFFDLPKGNMVRPWNEAR